MRQLSIENGNRHFLPWGAIVLKNCDQEGNLLNFDTLNTYKHQQLPLWIVLTLYLFKDAQNMIYPIFKCEHCETMNVIDSLKTHQEKARMQLSKCIHSVISEKLVEDDGGWRERWEVVCDRDIAQSNNFRVLCDEETRCVPLESSENVLVAIQTSGKISLLFTVTCRSETPMCSKCSSKNCKCLKLYKTYQSDLNLQQNLDNNSDTATDDNISDSDDEFEEHHQDELDRVIYEGKKLWV